MYLVSVTGVTGVQAEMQSRVEGLVSTLHSVTDKPVRILRPCNMTSDFCGSPAASRLLVHGSAALTLCFPLS